MIGIPAFLIGVGFSIFPLLFLWAVYYNWRHTNNSGNLVPLAFLALFFLVTSNQFVHNVANHLEVRLMRPAAVTQVDVDGKAITNPQEFTPIVSALNDSTWFSYNHGGAARRVQLVIYFSNGARRSYDVGYYRRQEGAVIEFRHHGRFGITTSYGEAFSAKLPKALADAGQPLPRD